MSDKPVQQRPPSAADPCPTSTPWRERLTLPIAEAAELLGVSEDSVQLLIESGDLDARLVGRDTLIVVSSLVRWADGGAESR